VLSIGQYISHSAIPFSIFLVVDQRETPPSINVIVYNLFKSRYDQPSSEKLIDSDMPQQVSQALF
jgi:hypothetical protein